MRISVRVVTTVLAAGAIMLSIIGLVLALKFTPATPLGPRPPLASSALLRLFDLDEEGNVPTWFEASLMGVGAALCALFASTQPARGATRWWLLSATLVAMSCDEAVGFHETLGRFLSARIDAERLDVYAWLLPGIIVAAVIVVFARSAAAALAPPARRRVLLGGILFFTGALGIELVEAVVDAHIYGSTPFALLAWVEESLELTGIILLINGVMSQLRDDAAAPASIVFTD